MTTQQWLIALHLCSAGLFVHLLGFQYNLQNIKRDAKKAYAGHQPFILAACAPALTCPVYMLIINKFIVMGMATVTTIVAVGLIPHIETAIAPLSALYCTAMILLSMALYFSTSATIPEPLIGYIGAVAAITATVIARPLWIKTAHEQLVPRRSAVALGVISAVLGLGWGSYFIEESPLWPILGPTISSAALMFIGSLVGL